MKRLAAIAAGCLSAAGVLALMLSRRFGGALEVLSPLRAAALRAVGEVVPSAFPDAKFQQLAPSYKPEDPAWREMLTKAGVDPDRYTTCGELPRYVGDKIGVNTKGGLSSVRDLGLQNGAWTVATGANRPKPGDFYLLAKDPAGREILHVGVIVDASGSTWKTADAGQGGHPNQAAAYVDRPYDATAITLGGPAGARYLVGWYDIDKGGALAA